MVPSHIIYAAVPISVLVTIGLVRKWRSRNFGKCTSTTSLRGKTIIITGANSGIGFETAKSLVKRKARVILACRSLNKAKEAAASIRKEVPNGGELIPMHLDLTSFESIENFAGILKAAFHKIDVLINNAGVVVPMREDMKTAEGFEIHLGVNHLGHFHLTNLLLDQLMRAAPSRIVVVSSTLHERGQINFDDINLKDEIVKAQSSRWDARHNPGYCNSKLMNMYFMKALSKKLKASGVDVNACCPGFCCTNLFRYSISWFHYILMAPIFLLFMRSAKEGSETVVYCATDYNVEGETGNIYRDCTLYNSKHHFNYEEAEKLWKISEELVKARKPL